MDNAVDVWRLITASRLQYAAPRRMRLEAAPIIPRAATLRRGGSLLYPKGGEPIVAKGKYRRWLEPDGLLLLEGWARDGLTDEQLSEKMGITPATLYDWKNKYPEISEALKKGKEVVDIQVENSLLKRALGYEYTEERIEISEKDGKKVIQTVKQVIPDTTAIIFWLKNRRPGKWRSDPQENGNTAQAGAHSALIAAIRERRHAN